MDKFELIYKTSFDNFLEKSNSLYFNVKVGLNHDIFSSHICPYARIVVHIAITLGGVYINILSSDMHLNFSRTQLYGIFPPEASNGATKVGTDILNPLITKSLIFCANNVLISGALQMNESFAELSINMGILFHCCVLGK